MMTKAELIPRTILCFAGIILLIMAIITKNSDSTIDMHFADTYYIFSSSYAYMVCGIFLLLLWIIYRLLRSRNLVPILTWTHVLISLAAVLALLIAPMMVQDETETMPSFLNNDPQRTLFRANDIVWIAANILAGVQALLPANIFVSVFRKTGGVQIRN